MKVNLNQLDIPRASASTAKALELVNHEEPDTHLLERAIMHDPVLASTLLRYANSPLMHRATEVTNVPAALRLLGLNSVRSAVVTAAIRSLLPKDNRASQVILDHMVSVSGICKLVATEVCREAADELEFLGLVHDVGLLTLLSNFEAVYTKLFERALVNGLNIDLLERDEFGISHNIVSARTAQEFRLPKLHVELLQNFHGRLPIEDIQNERDRDTCVLALAHLLYHSIRGDQGIKETVPESIEHLCSLLSISQDKLVDLTGAAQRLLADTSFP